MENIIIVKSGESIVSAQQKARNLKNATVIVEKGFYRELLEFDERDSGTTYIGEGAVLTGGLEVSYSETKDIPEEIKELEYKKFFSKFKQEKRSPEIKTSLRIKGANCIPGRIF